MSTPEDIIETIWRRKDFIDLLSDGTQTKHDFMDELGYSDQTVYMRLRELRDRHLIERSGDEYRLTPFAELVLDKFREIEELSELGDILSGTSVADQLDTEVLEDAEITLAEGRVPDKILEYISDKLMRSTEVEGFTCTLHSPSRIEAYYEAIVGEGVELEVVTTEEVVGYLRSEHSEKLASALESGNLKIQATENEIPFTTLVFDKSEVAVIIFESDAEMKNITSIKCLITNGSAEAVEWAIGKLEEYKQRSKKARVFD